ncbi:hypothetical protein RB594_006827 [Gaeumannomyces avenae]
MHPHLCLLVQSLLVLALATSSTVLAAFGFTRSGNNFVIDAGSANPLVFQVDARSCDINSILYRGTQLQSSGGQGTHIGSGLGSATVSASQLTGGASGKRYVRVTCATPTLTHYMVVREGDSSIFLATHITQEPSIGELRFLARLNANVLSGEYPFGDASTTAGSSSTVEGSDVFVVNGQTRSKFYSSTRFMDRDAQCVYGGSDLMHVCVVVPNMESSSGGPFFRDIESNNAGGGTTNLYNYMNSGHAQTEPYRMGLHGPYVMSFSRSGRPTLRDTDLSFFDEIPGIQGYVPASGRGFVSGTASGVPSSFQAVVHWHNAQAQYWTVASPNGGAFTSPAMKPGTYTMVLYQTEYKVATATVTVAAGRTATANMASTLRPAATSIFKIGEYDGQPTGFRNADRFLRMHPSDGRMAAWGPLTYTVGSSAPADFPMAQFQAVNNPTTIRFNLASPPPAAAAATLRIATTLSFAGSRPRATVNGWAGPSPPAPVKIDSRGVTRGAYRGWGDVYDVNIPAGTLKAGQNTITIESLSGSSGSTFLSPNFIYDCVELFTN